MAEENKVQEVVAAESHDKAEPHGEPNYKELYEKSVAESRKWEERSKANFEKAKLWDEAEEKNKTVEEKLAALTAENKTLKDEKARAELVSQIAKATGVDRAIIASLNGADEETLTAQAKAIADAYAAPAGAPSVPEAGKFPKDSETAKDDVRAFVRDMFSGQTN